MPNRCSSWEADPNVNRELLRSQGGGWGFACESDIATPGAEDADTSVQDAADAGGSLATPRCL